MTVLRSILAIALGVSCSFAQKPGILTTAAGGGPFTIALDGTLALNAALFALTAVAVSPAGEVYFAIGGGKIANQPAGPQVVAKILSGGAIKVIAGGTSMGFGGDGGPAARRPRRC